MESKNKRLAKNTVFLYVRMLFLMIISLFTVRVVLNTLGVEDYGIYNLIGSVVVLFSFINASSSASTQRYLNFALGENDNQKATEIFSSSFFIHIVVAFIVLLFSEIVGLYFINFYLDIPRERIVAANWAFQFSILTTVINIIKIPYNATIIAYEKMSFFALLSILEGILKLLIVYILYILPFDKLILYSFLLMIVSMVVFLAFFIYSKTCFSICKVHVKNDKELYRELISFSGWNLISSIGDVASTQGITFILNKFYGVVANAAMGVANQVNNAVYGLISNFQVAFEPQIVKSYAAKENDYLLNLIFKTSKFSFFLLYFFVLPLGLNAEFVLTIWLKEVPLFAVSFLRFTLIFSLCNALIGPLWMVAYAIGDIRNYQIVAFINAIFQLPLIWILFRLHMPPYMAVCVRIFSLVLFSLWRLRYLYKRMGFPVFIYIKKVIIPIIMVTTITFLLTYISYVLTVGLLRFFVSCVVSVLVNTVVIYVVGCTKDERMFIKKLIRRKGD